MKKIALVLSVLLLVLSFSACSIIQNAIPDQSVENLLGINDTEISAQLTEKNPKHLSFSAPLHQAFQAKQTVYGCPFSSTGPSKTRAKPCHSVQKL